jgi:hypothetical protein
VRGYINLCKEAHSAVESLVQFEDGGNLLKFFGMSSNLIFAAYISRSTRLCHNWWQH